MYQPTCGKCFKKMDVSLGVTLNCQLYHWNCLECVSCKKPLNAECVVKDGNPHCASCEPNFFPICIGCNNKITTHDFQWIDDRLWHEACSICCICKQQSELNFHQETNSLYCKEHFPGQFQAIPPISPPSSPQPNLLRGFFFLSFFNL